jgi:hypothetical protein
MNTEKRSHKPGHEALDLFPTPTHTPPGARQGIEGAPPSGGGYSDECSSPNAAVGRAGAGADPRIEELRRMGIGRPWAAVARAIGFDAFVEMWRVLDSMPDVVDERHRVCVPSFRTFLRFQRNQVIRDLDARGHSPGQIAQTLRRDLREEISDYHVVRVLKHLTD